MSKFEQAVPQVFDYLSHHRYEPPERDGWFSSSEIQAGIRNELDGKVRTIHVLEALDFLQNEVEPPIVEDAWMMSNDDRAPVLNERYQHPVQPDEARRFYRVISTSVEYIEPESTEQ
jgi:hypothetical protein